MITSLFKEFVSKLKNNTQGVQVSLRKHNRDTAFYIAEAGINYYRWHLAHAQGDYQDGQNYPGPYVHEYKDKDGTVVGIFSLEIDPPPAGGTVVVIRSTGWVLSQPASARTIQVRFGYPGLTDYVFVEDVVMRFSQTTEVHGKVHSNIGIEFNGTTDSFVESATSTYYDTSYSQWKPGVWGTGGPAEFFNFPVASKNFDSISADLKDLEELADTADGDYLGSSGDDGFHIKFLADGTYNLYTVTRLWCYNGDPYEQGHRWYWSALCFDIRNETLTGNYPIPANGAIFAEDNIWV